MEENANVLSEFLVSHPSTKYFRLHFVALSGILRTRILTAQYFLSLVSEGQHVKIGGKAMLHSVTAKTSSIVPTLGLVELRPDWRSLRPCGYAPGHASVMCCVYDRHVDEGDDPFHLCPRQKLSRFLKECETSHGRKFWVGFEIEFVLLDALGEPLRTNDNVNSWCTTSGLRGNTLKLMEDTIEALQASGIYVLHLHSVEPNQLQIATKHSNPMDATDLLMYTHECIKHKAAQYGLRATMAPKALKEHLCTGAHAHISIHPPTGQDHFLAGILGDLQSLCAFGLPSFDSYSRVTGISNASGTWVTWGTENRFVPIRGIEAAHWELRYLDATANVYLFLLMTITAGMHGLKENIPLKHSDCQLNPFKVGEEERTKLGIVEPMPASLKESTRILEKSTTFDTTLGKSLKEHYVAVKKLDEREMSTWSEDQRREWFTKLF